jgi:hypothetical protein
LKKKYQFKKITKVKKKLLIKGMKIKFDRKNKLKSEEIIRKKQLKK